LNAKFPYNDSEIPNLSEDDTPPSSPLNEHNICKPVTSLPVPLNEKFPYNDSEIPNLSEDDIIDACNKIAYGEGKIARISTTRKIARLSTTRKIVHISTNTIVKFGFQIDQAEARNMEFVAKNAPSIRVPKTIRTFQKTDECNALITYIVMEFIPGTVLSMCWKEMCEDRRENICDQVVNAITTLQSFKLQTIGPIGGKEYWIAPREVLFSPSGTKAKTSISDLERWYDFALDLCKKMRRQPQDAPVFKDSFGTTLPMTHLDIAPRNIIVQDDDTICIIDWEDAGAYPAHFERMSLEHPAEEEDKEFANCILKRLPEEKEKIKQQVSIRWAMSSFSLPD